MLPFTFATAHNIMVVCAFNFAIGFLALRLAFFRRRNQIFWFVAAVALPLSTAILFFLRPISAPRIIAYEKTPNKERNVVVLIHGIRTDAPWFGMVSEEIRGKLGLEVHPIKFGFFDIFSFLFPFVLRRFPVDKVSRELQDIQDTYSDADLSIISHSFGTYAVMEALKISKVSVRRIVLCGSVLKADYRKADIKCLAPSVAIVNECGSKDVWPVLAKISTWGYGDAGTSGLGTSGVRDRHHNIGHSDYFSRHFVRKFWLPFIKDGFITPTEWESHRPPSPYWLSILGILPVRWLWFIPLAICVYGLAEKYGYQPLTEPITSLAIGHAGGDALVLPEISFENPTGHFTKVQILSASLFSPSGHEQPLVIVGLLSGGRMYPTNSVDADLNLYQRTSSEPVFAAQTPAVASILNRAQVFCGPIGPNPDPPNPTAKLLPEDLVRDATILANSTFLWTPGEWRIVINIGDESGSYPVEKKFILDEGAISLLKKNIDFYSSGIGLCPNWLYWTLPDSAPILKLF